MHFLIRLALHDLPSDARILCVGVGTGAEMIALAQHNPHWTFTGVDPSADMLEVCHERLQLAGIGERCTLQQGYVHDVPASPVYDAALSVLVGHFVSREDRCTFYGGMCQRLKQGGHFINTEISCDLDSPEFGGMLACWEQVQALMGATPQAIAAIPLVLREKLCVLPPFEVEEAMRVACVQLPTRFFQAFMITGWHGRRL
ncbi:MAG: class I SAM-dependent methyltransferase [Desulfovibrio sp.]|uniref:class I SAM-dependent methyltransferase n=1 Tax=Desulfovibrio sp. TaxID=885 RepID=UPI00135E3B8D|nr:class I SAM-dependent methyltransferase [Desulfovibrio sp.]MTJ92188.1 class I SAM-dependent methyltransferase [Desulfovibrio sp.]